MKILSDVFPPEIKPVHEGLYLTMAVYGRSPDVLARWRNGGWVDIDSGNPLSKDRYWQGLAFDPESARTDGRWVGLEWVSGWFILEAQS